MMKKTKKTKTKRGVVNELRYYEAVQNPRTKTWNIYRYHKSEKNNRWYKKEYISGVADSFINEILNYCDKKGV